MISTLRSRPNHYEVLGLTPAASQEEIAQAFARGMSLFRPHTFGTLAELSVAYETLRDPARRRAYDASLAPKPEPSRPAVSFAGSARWEPMVRATIDPVPPTAAGPQPKPQDPLERRLAEIAATVRELARPAAARPQPRAQNPQPQPEPTPQPRPEPMPQPHPQPPDLFRFAAGSEPDAEQAVTEQPFEWRRPALAVGGFVLAAGLVGALAGLSVKDEAQQPALSVALPAAKPRPGNASSSPVPAPATQSAVAEPPVRFLPVAAPRTRRSASPHRARSWAREVADQVQPADDALAQSQPAAAAADPLAPQAAAAQPVPASMPLPNRVIARTIERIGYACGDVASTSAVEGASGTFKVTCTSGQSYQAAPVRGRYHFRRLNGR